MRDAATGTDEELMADGDAPTIAISDERLEKLLKDKGVGEITMVQQEKKRRGSRARKGEDVFVDRI